MYLTIDFPTTPQHVSAHGLTQGQINRLISELSAHGEEVRIRVEDDPPTVPVRTVRTNEQRGQYSEGYEVER